MINKTTLSLITDKNLQKQLSLVVISSTLNIHVLLKSEFETIKKGLDKKDITSLGSVKFNQSGIYQLLELETKLKCIESIVQKNKLDTIEVGTVDSSVLCDTASSILNEFSNTIEYSDSLFKLNESQKNERLALASLLNDFNQIVHVKFIELSYNLSHENENFGIEAN